MTIQDSKVELLSRLRKGKGKIHVPEGTIAVYDAADGPFKVKGQLINEGTIAIKGGKTAKVVILAREIQNKGKIEADVQKLALLAGSMENTGEISGAEFVEVVGTSGPLTVSSKSGRITASEEIVLDSALGLDVVDGSFSAPSIKLKAKRGVASVAAESLDGKVSIMARSGESRVSANAPTTPQSLLSGTHAYYNYGASFYLAEDIDHGSDEVGILSTNDVTIDGNITCGKLTIAAGVSFKIGGSYPPSGQIEDSASSWSIETPGGGGYATVNGDLQASDDVNADAWTFEVYGETVSIDGYLTTSANTRFETSGSINIQDDIGTTRAANILLFSDGDVGTGAITIDNSAASYAGRLCIKANRSGGSSEFIIGDSSNSNGVNGAINVDTVNGGGSDTGSYWYGGVYISNGGDGGITVTNATDISVKATQSKSGGIILDAHDGTITLPAGTLSADGTGNYPGAMIQLLADTIEVDDGTIISASDNGQGQTQKIVQIAANTINFSGTSGLTIKADGGGNESTPDYVQIVPKGSVTIQDNDSVIFLNIWSWLPNGSFNNTGAVAFAGGSAPLNISCNGSHSRIELGGYPLTFAGGELTVECKGEEDHEIMVAYYGTPSGINGVQFNCDDVTIDASGTDSEDADGGTVTFYMPKPLRSDDGKIIVKADGSQNGNGGHIVMYPGDVDLALGTDDEQWAFSAKGGATSGDGGSIELYGYESALEVFGAGPTTTVLDVSVPGDDGNGGEISIVAYDGLTFDGTASHLKADGGSSSGDGGTITILTSVNEFVIGTGETGAVQLSAIANGGDGKGGTIDITSWSGITADSAYMDVTADGDGDGGMLSLNAGYSTFELNGGTVHADGGDSGGNGGLVHLEGGQILLPAEDNTLVTADGKEGGNGGTVEVTTQWAAVDFGSDDGQLLVKTEGSASSSIRARSLVAGSGKGGNIEIIQQESFDLEAGATLSVKSFTDGDGGVILIQCSDTVSINGPVNADGVGTGVGGSISIESPTITLGTGATFSADAGVSGDGQGGAIALKNDEGTEIDLSSITEQMFSAKGAGSGEGGHVTIEKVGQFSLHALIKVDGGADATTDDLFGTITLNGIACIQRKTGWEDWPQTYWKSGPVADMVIANHAHDMNSHVRAALENYPVHIYYMENANEFNTYFSTVSPYQSSTSDGGYSIPLLGVSAVYKELDLGSGMQSVESATGVSTIKKANTAHECGHQMDVIWGGASGATGTGSFDEAKNDDYTYGDINTDPCSTVFDGTAVCNAFSGSNAEKLEQFAANGHSANPELFAHVFQHVIFPNTSLSSLENALTYLDLTEDWMENKISTLP